MCGPGAESPRIFSKKILILWEREIKVLVGVVLQSRRELTGLGLLVSAQGEESD